MYLLFGWLRNRARIDLFSLLLSILIRLILEVIFGIFKDNGVLVDRSRDMQRVNFTLLITDLERFVFVYEVIHMHLFFEAIVANGEIIEQPSLIVFASFKFELFQILNIFCQTLMKVLFPHERRNPADDNPEHFPGLNLHLDLMIIGVISCLIRIQFIVFFAHFL